MKLFLTFVLFLTNFPAYSYIGPGMGAGVIAAVLGVLGAIVLVLLGILYYPIKRLIKKLRKF